MDQTKQIIILAVDDFSAEQQHIIKSAVEEWALVKTIAQTTGEAMYRQQLATADICIGWPNATWLKGSPVKFLQIGSSGWDAYQHEGLEAIGGFHLCTAKGIYTIGLVEHAIAMMFALVRRLPAHFRDKEQGAFKRHLPYAPEITGARACIVGMGDAGILLAGKLKRLDMYVTAVLKTTARSLEDADKVFQAKDLKHAVADADHIFLLVPGTPENENLFDKAIFDVCKPSAYFYNLSRGSNVEEKALYESLVKNKIAGAGLDVTGVEPLPPGDRLWKLGDNVLITGHSAGLSTGHPQRFCELVIRNLSHYHFHRPLENRVI
ncbi:MAG: NAD(P)-dependent oxidoreductase [Chitinophagaceae bacterium]